MFRPLRKRGATRGKRGGRRRKRRRRIERGGGVTRRSDRELDLERKRDRAEEARRSPAPSEGRRGGFVGGAGGALRVEGGNERSLRAFVFEFYSRRADNTRSRRELRDSCFIREGKRRLRAMHRISMFPSDRRRRRRRRNDARAVRLIPLPLENSNFPLSELPPPPYPRWGA
jgi:hypothetical protein